MTYSAHPPRRTFQSAADFAVETRDLARYFGSFKAVDGVNLTIRRGEMYGFLGPNGAGKTTTLRMILGLLKPTAGEARLFGERVTSNSMDLKRSVGVAFEHQAFYDEMTALEYLLFFGRLYQVGNSYSRAATLLERLNLWHVRDLAIAGYSTGMQRKLSFARALMHSPVLLVLDEPVSGLDPFGIRQLREILLEEREKGGTVLISSHILSEIEQTADRVGILARGKMLAEDVTSALRSKVSSVARIEIELDVPVQAVIQGVAALPFVRETQSEGHCLQVFVDAHGEQNAEARREQRALLSKTIATQGALILDMRAVEPSLEEAFVQLTESVVDRLAEASPRGASSRGAAQSVEVAE